MTLTTYLKYRRFFEVAFCVICCCLFLTVNLTIIGFDFERRGESTPFWEPVVWEFSSVPVLYALIPLILAFDKRYPLRWKTFPISTLQHLLFSLIFSAIHVALMVGIRKVAYQVLGSEYHFGDLPKEFLYEYLKDGQTYLSFIMLIYLYQFILLRLQGEASVLDQNDETTEQSADKSSEKSVERLLVKKLGKEFLIHTKNINYIEASGNYVNIHVGERVYPLRSTMNNISEQLDKDDFRRVHRSFIVNVNQISEIQPLESGDATITLIDKTTIPVSRTYRAQLVTH